MAWCVLVDVDAFTGFVANDEDAAVAAAVVQDSPPVVAATAAFEGEVARGGFAVVQDDVVVAAVGADGDDLATGVDGAPGGVVADLCDLVGLGKVMACEAHAPVEDGDEPTEQEAPGGEAIYGAQGWLFHRVGLSGWGVVLLERRALGRPGTRCVHRVGAGGERGWGLGPVTLTRVRCIPSGGWSVLCAGWMGQGLMEKSMTMGRWSEMLTCFWRTS